MNLKVDYLDYLEYVLGILNSDISRGFNIDDIKLFYNKKSDIKIDNNAQRHFEKLYENKYIERTGNSRLYRIIPEIKSKIDNYGSLSAYLELIENDRLKKENEESEFKKIQLKNLELQNENLEFSKTIRDKESKIRELEFKIKKIELLKQYWWFIGICIFLGALLKELLDILIA
ncbi:MAG: hypothetical protein PHV20_14500 [Bacteroidales bacterium]|nr:hypothetical protein [Bacteroidales bacterium]